MYNIINFCFIVEYKHDTCYKFIADLNLRFREF